MRVIITIVCLFTPILGWIALLFFLQSWSVEDELRAKLREGGLEQSTPVVEQISRGVATGALIIIVVIGVTALAMAVH